MVLSRRETRREAQRRRQARKILSKAADDIEPHEGTEEAPVEAAAEETI